MEIFSETSSPAKVHHHNTSSFLGSSYGLQFFVFGLNLTGTYMQTIYN